MNTATQPIRTSTGPQTRKHALTTRDVVLREDELEQFESLQSDLTAQLDPQGPLEMLAFNRLLHNAWNLQRFRRLESELTAGGLDPLLDKAAAETLDRLHRYSAAADRAYARALNELRLLQTERALRRTLEPAQRAITPRLASVKQVQKAAQSPDSIDRAMELAIQRIDREPGSFRKNPARR